MAYQPIPLDPITGDVPTIDHMHFEGHEGELYVLPVVATIARTGQIKHYRFVTPNTTKRMHFKVFSSSEQKYNAQVFRGPTTSADGTDISAAAYNVNEPVAPAFTAEIWEDPTVTADGALRQTSQVDAIIDNPARPEIIGAQNEVYLIKYTALKDATDIHTMIVWYEE